MASVARCLRAAARPSTMSRLTQTSAIRSNWQARSSMRAFSATSIREIRKYTKDHEWIDLSADKTTGVIGISTYAAEELGDVVYVELPEDGLQLEMGDTLGAVESVKSAADINSPISCKVTAVNHVLEEKPGNINVVPEDDSHGGGWICKVSVTEQGAKDFETLMDEKEYLEYTASEHDH